MNRLHLSHPVNPIEHIIGLDRWSPAPPAARVIGLCGLAGSGKDTVADLLCAHEGFEKLSYANPIRYEVSQAYGIDPSFLTMRETKEHPLSCLALSRCADLEFVACVLAWHARHDLPFDLHAPRSPRQIMQWWGTEYRRGQRTDYWTYTMRLDLTALLAKPATRRVVITDVRFADEAALLRLGFKGQIWQVLRPTSSTSSCHISETQGHEFRPDVVINNCHSIGHLQERVIEAWGARAAV